MTKNAKIRGLLMAAAGVAGIVLGLSSQVRAGMKWNWPITIEGTGTANRTCSGSLLDVRNGGTSLDYIGCQYFSETDSIECYAQKGLSDGGAVRVYCTQASPTYGMVAGTAGLNAASVVRFKTVSGGVCKSIDVWNESDFL
jgi:hypothetical protein